MQWFTAIVSTTWCYLGNKRLSIHAFSQIGIHESRHAKWILSLLDFAVLPPNSSYQLVPSLTIDENSAAVQRLHHPSCNIQRDEGEYLAFLSSPSWVRQHRTFSKKCRKIIPYIQFSALGLSCNTKHSSLLGLGIAWSCHPKLCWWALAAGFSWASHPTGHQWTCVPLEQLNAWPLEN